MTKKLACITCGRLATQVTCPTCGERNTDMVTSGTREVMVERYRSHTAPRKEMTEEEMERDKLALFGPPLEKPPWQQKMEYAPNTLSDSPTERPSD